jgi:hypothetical protein
MKKSTHGCLHKNKQQELHMKLNEAPDDKLVGAYVSIRDDVAAEEAAFKARVKDKKEKLDKIEAEFLRRFGERGAESVRTTHGTAYKLVRTSATVADRGIYTDWILADPESRLSYLDVRANKKEIEQFKGEHGDIPPGLNWREELTVGFRRA